MMGWKAKDSPFVIPLFGAAILFVLSALTYSFHRPPDPGGFPKRVVIPPKTGLLKIAKQLTDEGILRSPLPFLLQAKLLRVSSKIQAGEYLFMVPEMPRQVLAHLVKGEILLHRVTIPEGFTMKQIAALLEEKGVAKEEAFLRKASDPALLQSLGIERSNPEGYLFPETYYFPAGLDEREIVRTMVGRFWEVMGEKEQERARHLGLSVKEIVTLASMIEKETSVEDEKRRVSSVFHNRLLRNLRLECDPTVIYGIPNFDGNLTREHLKSEGPYNTYVIQGLPPGPIANPGQSSLMAALHPERSDYLYFVSKNDGTHHFSKTLAEHNLAVQRYQKSRGPREPK